jgi:hypothetical protein
MRTQSKSKDALFFPGERIPSVSTLVHSGGWTIFVGYFRPWATLQDVRYLLRLSTLLHNHETQFVAKSASNSPHFPWITFYLKPRRFLFESKMIYALLCFTVFLYAKKYNKNTDVYFKKQKNINALLTKPLNCHSYHQKNDKRSITIIMLVFSNFIGCRCFTNPAS